MTFLVFCKVDHLTWQWRSYQGYSGKLSEAQSYNSLTDIFVKKISISLEKLVITGYNPGGRNCKL